MKNIKTFNIELLSNNNLKVVNARRNYGNDSVINELKLLDEVNGNIYYFILNHLDLGPIELYLLDTSIFSRLKRIGEHTEEAFIDFINDSTLELDLDSLDFEEIESLPYSQAILTILMLNDEGEDAIDNIKNKYLKDIDTSEVCF